MTIREDLKILRWKQFKWALEETKGNQRAAAKIVNLPCATFDRWMRELYLQRYAETLRMKNQTWRVWKRNSYGAPSWGE